MIQTVEAVIDESGGIRLLQPVRITGSHRALVTILEEELSVDLPGKEAPGNGAENALDDRELARWHEALAGARVLRERMAEKYGVQPDTTEIIRATRDHSRA